jgi:hypothetical protein
MRGKDDATRSGVGFSLCLRSTFELSSVREEDEWNQCNLREENSWRKRLQGSTSNHY